MVKILVLLILLTFTGCQYNIADFVMPNDREFMAIVEELNTPQKIGEYMNDNFEYEHHPFNVLSPYELFIYKKGDCDDMACFGTFIANYHGYETYQIIIWRSFFRGHMLSVYTELNEFSFMSNMFYYPPEYNSFREIVEYFFNYHKENWIKYIVYNYNMEIVERGKKD